MRNDIYNRNPQDPNYIIGQIEMEDTLDLFKQQIESCLFTSKTTVMGSTDFGASLDEYIWSFSTSASSLKSLIVEQINQFCTFAKYYPYSVHVDFHRGTIKDIASITIEIDGREKFAVIVA